MEKIGKKLKHDHTLTSILKFAIFSMVMLAPIFSVATRCLYVICNKNAKDSYSNEKIKTIQLADSESLFVSGYDYYVKYNNNPSATNYSTKYYFSYLSFNPLDYGFSASVENYNYFQFYPNNTSGNVYFRLHNTTTNTDENRQIWGTTLKEFNFTLSSISTPYNQSPSLMYFYTYTTQKLDNAFEYSISQLEESEYYNWATNLGIYTPINNMVNGLGGHSVISLLLAYWSIYTAIYIVFDIIITCFVKITHLIQGE